MPVPATPARRVQVFVGEADHIGHQPSYRAMLDYLRREGAAGATVERGVAGFGVHSRIHQASILDLSADLPMTLTWIDRPDEVDRLLPGLLALAGSGIVSVEDVSVVGAGEQHLHHERRGGAPQTNVDTDTTNTSPAETA